MNNESFEIIIENAITTMIFIFFLAIPIYFTHNKKNKNDKIKTLIDPSNTLEVSNLTFSIGKTRILSDISVKIKKREIMGLLGLNGSGKTTFINVLLGKYDLNSIGDESQVLLRSKTG